MNSPRLPLSLLSPLVALGLLAGCNGPDRKAMLEEARHSVPPMAGGEVFFDGGILAEMTLSGGGAERFRSEPGLGLHNDGMSVGVGNTGMLGSSMGEGTFGSGAQRRGGSNIDAMAEDDGEQDDRNSGGRRGSRDGTYQGNRGMRGESENRSEVPRQHRHDTEMPAAMMRFRLKNTTEATVVVEIRELNSNLGNFAVRPDTVKLEPGQSVEVEPMQSLLGVDAFNLPVTVSLRAGGQTETKVINLKLVKPAPTPPEPAR